MSGPAGVEPQALLVFVTIASAEEGRALARDLVSSRLAACVNVIPGITSIYRWQNAVEESAETLLVLKTTPERYPELEAAIRSRHSYELPEILALPVAAGFEPYLAWVRASVEGA